MKISAPAVSSARTTASCCRLQASISAVDPCTVWQSMSAPGGWVVCRVVACVYGSVTEAAHLTMAQSKTRLRTHRA
jgi:hypothetical protein